MNARSLASHLAPSSRTLPSHGQTEIRRPAPRESRPVHLVALSSVDVYAFHPAPGGRLLCRRGVVWVTQEGDRRDHVLSTGDEVTFARSSKVAVQAISNGATVQLP